MMRDGAILSVWRAPFTLEPRVAYLPEGMTLAEMAARMPDLPPDFDQRGVICIAGHPVPRQNWARVRPRAMLSSGAPVEVTFHAPPMGGGGENGGKKAFALVASIALSLGVGAILGGKLATAGGLFKAGSLSASLLATGVSLAGSLVLASLSSPPVADQRARSRPNEGTASAQGNVLEPNGAIPRVLGSRKVFPPFAVEPLTYFDGPDEVVEAVYCLAGPHQLTDLRVGAAPIADMTGVDFETREGWPGDAALSMITRQSRTVAVQAELTGHRVDEVDGSRLDTFSDVTVAVPQKQIVVSARDADEVWLHVAFAQGLHYQGDETVRLRVPVRLRIREKGSSIWINLPELHFAAANIRQMRSTIKLIWTDSAATPQAPNLEGWVEARRQAAGQTDAPASDPWVADAAFGASGDVWMAASNLGSTGVQGVELERYTARIFLNSATFPKGRYEIELQRGCAVREANYVASAYTVSGSVWDLFGYRSPAAPQIAQSRDGISDALYLLRCVSIKNEAPVASGDLALIAVRARNIALDQVSVVAGGYVRDWDGSGWNTWTVTSNPAPHLRDVLVGRMNANAVPVALIEDQELVDWRAACASNGWTCNHLAEDQSVTEVARILTSAGYASLRQSETWGVVRDYDRSAESPVQIFTPLNSSGFSFQRAFADLPDGFRVTFADSTDDWNPRQIDVPRVASAETLLLPEMVSYEGLDNEADVVARAQFDLMQAELRSTFYSLDAPVEAIICRRGDLVGVTHDVLSEYMGSARIVGHVLDGGLVVGLILDAPVKVSNEPEVFSVTDIFAVEDVFALGLPTSVMVRGPNGVGPAIALTDASGVLDEVTLADPQDPADVPIGALAVFGLAGQETLRLVVKDITPREDLTASLTLVDEASELFA